MMQSGDCMVWSSLTPHFTLPPRSFPVERLSLQVLVRPAGYQWGDFMSQPFDHASVEMCRVNRHFSVRVLR